jgi:DNA transposition AAA+ family ATPase
MTTTEQETPPGGNPAASRHNYRGTIMSEPSKPGKISEAEQEVIRNEVLELIRVEDMTRRVVAAESGIPYGTVTPFLGGTYAGDGSKIAASLRVWMAARAKRATVRATLPVARFVATPTADAIMSVLQHAQHMPDMVVVTGAPGTGKSSAACEYTRQNPNVFKVVAQRSINSVRSMLGAIAHTLGTYDMHSTYRISRDIEKKLLAHPGALLIVDEAQHFDSGMLDQLRSFHDQCGIGIALVGNDAIVGALEGGRRSAEYAQLYSRVGMRLKRPRPLNADIDGLLDAWEVAAGPGRDLLRGIAKKPGGLRSMAKTHRLALMLANAENRPLAEDDVRLAWERLGAAPNLAA